MRDSRALTEARINQIEDCLPIEEETKNKAQRVIAANALNVEDAIEMMMMLGVHPRQGFDGYVPSTLGEMDNGPVRQAL